MALHLGDCLYLLEMPDVTVVEGIPVMKVHRARYAKTLCEDICYVKEYIHGFIIAPHSQHVYSH